MKNGFLNKGDKQLLPFNSSDNIEHQGLKLSNWLSNLKKSIINIFNITHQSLVGICFNSYTITSVHVYEDVDYNNVWYDRASCYRNYEVTADGIKIKNVDRVSLIATTEIRCNSNVNEPKYLKVQVYRNGVLFNEEFTTVSIPAGGFGVITLPYFYYAEEGDIIKVKVYGSTGDVAYATRVNMQLANNNEANYYNF